MKGKTWLRHRVVSVGKHLAGNRLFVIWTPLVNEYEFSSKASGKFDIVCKIERAELIKKNMTSSWL